MKVSDINRMSNDKQAVTALQDRPAGTETGLSFKRQITDLNEAQYHAYLEDLKDRIFEQGEEIKKKSDICGFLKYRQLIAELMGEAASNAYSSSKSGAYDIRGKHKVFILIKKVNSKLDEMAQEVLAQQSDNINLLQMVDDIRGMLVDMFL